MKSIAFVFLVAIFVGVKDGVLSYNQNNWNQGNRRAVQCPPLNCHPSCSRFIGPNGCHYCGQCGNSRTQLVCPPVKCPNQPNLKCGIVTASNGCKQCICIQVEHQKRIYQPQFQQLPPNHHQRNYHQQPNYHHQQHYQHPNNQHQPNFKQPYNPHQPNFKQPYNQHPTNSKQPNNQQPNNNKPKNCPMPQCSVNCQIVKGPDGCDHCKCSPPVNCNWALSCPPNCNRTNNGVGGCPQCECDDVAVCPQVPCDLNRCRHVVDPFTGCAIKCECNNIPNPRASQPVY